VVLADLASYIGGASTGSTSLLDGLFFFPIIEMWIRYHLYKWWLVEALNQRGCLARLYLPFVTNSVNYY
jgi:hypothetical protein